MSAPNSAPDIPTKAVWRRRILAARAALSVDEHDTEAEALAVAVRCLADEGTTICAYVPVGTEPGSLGLLTSLSACGARVLLPVTDEEPGPLDWSAFTSVDDLGSARFGLLEPTGKRLGQGAIGEAAAVLAPAVAVDRRGVRLGRGAGFYDRSLELADPAAKLIAVVRDSEVVDELPEEPHDRRMGWVLTPGAGLSELVSE